MQKLTQERSRLAAKLKRSDLNAMEKADILTAIFSAADVGAPPMMQADLCELIGYSVPWVSNHMRLHGLSEFTKNLVRGGSLTFADAKALASLPHFDGDALAVQKISEHWTSKKLEAEASKLRGVSRREKSRQAA